MTLTTLEVTELPDLDSEIMCEGVLLCGRPAALQLFMVCGCTRFGCMPCRNQGKRLGFDHHECWTCGAPLDGPWEKIIIRERPL